MFVLGSPFIAHVEGDLPLVSGNSLTSAPVSTTSHFTMSNVSGSLDDIEVNVEGKLSNQILTFEFFHSIYLPQHDCMEFQLKLVYKYVCLYFYRWAISKISIILILLSFINNKL